MKNLQVGQKVIIRGNYGLGQFYGEGTVTFNDPKSPYISVDGYQYRKYEVEGVR